MKTTDIKQRIQQELISICAILTKVKHFIEQIQNPDSQTYQEAIINAIALSLHSFYTGLERIFEIVARFIDYREPTGMDWHKQLLEQMSIDLPDVRQKVISQSTLLALDEFRRFRHVVRSIYAYQLETTPVLELGNKAFIVYQNFEQEINEFLQSI
ncbi:conserved hypothetical protein [Rippkaea orientalis PCC 8801]|uniref:HepT-like domain-containing protein n=1 Tax=Rippkaea orientalis (strain PCC 8801 / RF-1) TaxID=41431 RepID=B7JUX8_RIPO1|nr:hypothetical protein [Rippkaea orientalis]ACK66830.1 conserved hypothetical protein [Rippkaea orientalis PCC 8801]